MAIMERKEGKNAKGNEKEESIEQPKELIFGESIVIRLEEILNGTSFEKLKEISDRQSETQIESFDERLKVLREEKSKLPENPNEDPHYQKYVKDLEFAENIAHKDYKKLTYGEVERLHNLYTGAMQKSFYGPHEFYRRGLVGEKDFEVLNDGIVMGMQARLKDMLPLPKSLDIDNKISYLTSAMANLEYYKKSAFPLAVNRFVLFENFGEIMQILSDIREKYPNKKIEIVIDDDGNKVRPNDNNSPVPYHYNKSERKMIFELKDLVNGLWFSEFFQELNIPLNREELWNFSEVMASNYDINMFVQLEKSLKLSPFEELLLTNLHLSESEYSGSATTDERTRTFLTAIDARSEEGKEEIEELGLGYVCTGEACHAKAIFDERNNKDIEATIVPTMRYSKATGHRRAMVPHSFLLMHLKDDKYGIDTYGVYDPTWSGENLDFIMSPVEDFENFEKWHYYIDHKELSNIEKYLYLDADTKIDEKDLKNTIYDEYHDKCKPIPIRTYIRALTNVINKVKNSNSYVIGYDFTKEETATIVENVLTKTLKELRSISLQDSQNTFYTVLREYFEKNKVSYPDFKEFWGDYLKELRMACSGDIYRDKL